MVRRRTFFYALVAFLSALVMDASAATYWTGPAHYTLTLKNNGTENLNNTTHAVEGHIDLQLTHDTTCTVSMHVLRTDGELLLGPNNTKLLTRYKLTGTALTAPDTEWVDSATFRNKVYQVQTSGPVTETLTLYIQGSPTTGTNPPPGNYTTLFAMTVTW